MIDIFIDTYHSNSHIYRIIHWKKIWLL